MRNGLAGLMWILAASGCAATPESHAGAPLGATSVSIVLRSRNPVAMASFYGAGLGYPAEVDGSEAYVRIGGTQQRTIFDRRQSGTLVQFRSAGDVDGATFVIDVDDLERAVRNLEERSVPSVRTGANTVAIRDPEGRTIQYRAASKR